MGRKWKISTGNPNFKLEIYEDGLNKLRKSPGVSAMLYQRAQAKESLLGSEGSVRVSDASKTRTRVYISRGTSATEEADSGVLFSILQTLGSIGKAK